MQVVPAAICITADQTPLAQRWKEVPPMQFHIPSGLQAPLRAPLLELESFDEGAGELDGTTGAAGEDAAVADASGEAVGTKMPGATVWLAGVDATACSDDETVAGVEAAGAGAAEVPTDTETDAPGPGPPVQAA